MLLHVSWNRAQSGEATPVLQGAQYEVDSDLAGEEALLWWGLFEHELFAELNEKTLWTPYQPGALSYH